MGNTDRGFILDKTLSVINALEAQGIIGRYAIGGAIGLLFYTEPIHTEDLDIFCHVPGDGPLINLSPLYEHLAELGHHSQGEHVTIEGVPVQFLVPPNALVDEALANSVSVTVEGIPTRVFGYEYLLAIMAQTGRPRDRSKIAVAMDSAEPDAAKLEDILQRYNLFMRWTAITSGNE